MKPATQESVRIAVENQRCQLIAHGTATLQVLSEPSGSRRVLATADHCEVWYNVAHIEG